jgi:hypothetical protein
VFLSACNVGVSEKDVTFTRLSEVPKEKLEALSQKTYFFGHQSVGRNMLDGLRMLMGEHPELKLNIQESESVEHAAPGAFLHSNVGKNREPLTKIAQYESALESGLGPKVNAAFLKFCYVDMVAAGDPQALFDQYRDSVGRLKAKYPETTFVHFTLPLKSPKGGFKNLIKRLIGWEIPGDTDNVQRSHYNALLRAAYEGREPVFDIAKLESVDPATGKAFTFTFDGKEYEAMSPANTYDGGHLTDSGKRWIAEQLIVFLANLEGQWSH